ncbi:peptide chain release factor N(5)-glutamine methyltransferase [Tahibacter harae]|uniref:Release factor glutamine methyltransferase n=1 Tax=Tahibacter harae TaxID=2963937 RepID=A0ABT1QQP4_9GAMM|nr:peptide chain release factor N(5)-glutamine methyltransferase [Tahibacter harae]MCQ4164582.1 peptide chain release factor N(5)-glutamine methyltransferase [Tahibacter harae]
MSRLRDSLAAAAARLPGEEARLEAEVLLLHLLQRPRAWLFAHADDELDACVAGRYEDLVQRRLAGEPVAYLTGEREFWSLPLQVNAATLIPRADTERLVELALERLPLDRAAAVADLGTGSGAIALAIAKERPRAQVVATDRSAAALAVAGGNARKLSIGNVEFVESDWFAALRGRVFDLIVSNPPYIAVQDPHLSQGDLRFEPVGALASGADGLDDLRRIVAGACLHLRPGGWLLLEHGYDQGEAVRALLTAAGFADVATWRDLGGQERVSGGRAGIKG